MKNRLLILSNNKEFKRELVAEVESLLKIDYKTVSTRSDAISELSSNDFNCIVIDCTLTNNDLDLILKYLSTNEYYFCHIFFLSGNFEVFDEIIKQLNFPHLNLIGTPFNIKELAEKVSQKLVLKNTVNPDEHLKINLEFLKVFIDSAKKVFKDFCNLENIQHQKPFLKSDKFLVKYKVSGEIPLKSESFDGTFKIGFEEKIYLDIINQVLMIEADKIDEEILDFSGELVNMIYGQSKLVLNETGHNFLKVLPRFDLDPKDPLTKFHTIVVPLSTNLGIIYLEIIVKTIKGVKVV